ncbi:60S ribosomal protein L37, partial [Lemmus lemmus]
GLHLQKSACGKHGYPAKHKRKYNWSADTKRRNTMGTGQTSTYQLSIEDSDTGSVKGQSQNPRGPLWQHPVRLEDFNQS